MNYIVCTEVNSEEIVWMCALSSSSGFHYATYISFAQVEQEGVRKLTVTVISAKGVTVGTWADRCK